jgi:thioesterase domain-containing protein
LTPDMSVYSFIWPDSNADCHPSDNIETITHDFLEDLKGENSKGPYIVGGFCFGAVIAIELAKLLSKSGEQVELLVLIDPILPSIDPYRKQWVRRRIKNFRFYKRQGLRYYINFQIRRYNFWIKYLQSNPKEKMKRRYHIAHHRSYYHYRAERLLHRALLVLSHADHKEETNEGFSFEINRWKDLIPEKYEFLFLAECTHQDILLKGSDIISTKIRDYIVKDN